MAESIILDIQFDSPKAQKRIVELQKALNAQKQTFSELTNAYKAGLLSEAQYAQAQVNNARVTKELRDEQRGLARDLSLVDQAQKANEGSREQLNAQLLIAQKELGKQQGLLRRNADGTIELSDAYLEASRAVANAREALIEFDQNINDGRSNVGNYKNALKDVNENLVNINATLEKVNAALEVVNNAFLLLNNVVNTLGGSIIKFILGLVGINLSLNDIVAALARLRVAIGATGIGLLIIAFASLVSFLTTTEEGSNKLSQAFAGIGRIVSLILAPIQALGSAIFSVFEVAGQAAAGIADFFGAGVQDAANRVKQLQDIEKELILIESANARVLAEEERLKNIRDNEAKSTQDRIKANEELGRVEAERINAVIKLQQRKVDVLQKELDATPKLQRTTEQLKTLEEARTELADSIADSLGRQNEQLTNQVSLLRESAEIQNETKQILLDKEIAQGKIVAGSSQELKERIKLVKAQRDADLLVFTDGKKVSDAALFRILQTNDAARLAYEKRELEILQLQKGFNDEQASQFKELQDKNTQAFEQAQDAREARLQNTEDQELARLERLALLEEEGTAERIARENALLQAQFEVRVRREQLQGEALLLEQEKLNQQFEANFNVLLEKQREFDARDLQAIQQRIQLEQELEKSNREFLLAETEREAQNILALETTTNEERLALQKQLYDVRLFLLQQANAQELELINAQKLATEGDENLTDEEKLTKEAELNAKEIELLRSTRQQQIDIEQQYANAKIEISNLTTEQELANIQKTADALGNAASLFQEDTIAFKLLATAQATINTYLGANQALADKTPGLPTFVKIINAIAVIATGLKNVAEINKVKLAEGGLLDFARGGRVRGAGTGTSDSIPAQLSNGEAVLNARSMRSNDVVSMTGTPRSIASGLNSMYGGRKFADGGAVSLANPTAFNSNFDTSNIVKAVSQEQQMFISITELNNKQKDVQFTEQIANR